MSRGVIAFRLFVVGLLLIVIAVPGWGQGGTFGTVVGVVSDESGAVVPGAKVTATNTATSQSRSVASGSQGEYTITNLLPGTHEVSVEIQGFKKSVTPGVIVRVNDSVRVDFNMQVGSVVESVEVTALAQQLETTNATVGKVVNTTSIINLPLNGRDFTQLTLLLPGAAPGASAGGFFIIGGQAVAVTGNRSDQNNYTLDGVNNNETFFKHYGIRPSLDAIQEFKVQTNITSAEFGEAAGANVNVSIRSGTNEIHGSLFEFFRNNVLDARDSFAAKRPQFRWNQFGGTVGGPISKNRTFFFGNYEGFRLRRESTVLSTVPTAAMMGGNFSQNVDGTPGAPIYDIETTRPNPSGSGFIRDPFPGNIIPSDRFNPVSLSWQENLYAKFPENIPGQPLNFVNTTPDVRDDNQFTIRVDHKFNDKNNLFGRYSYSDLDDVQPQSFPGLEVTFFNHFRNYVVSDVHTFSPTSVLEVKFGFNQDDIQRQTPGGALGLVPGLVSAGLQEFPAKFRDKMDFPLGLGIAGFTGAGLTAFQSGPQKTWQILPSFTKIMGRQSFKFGADIKVRHVLHDGVFASIDHDRLTTSDPQDAAGITGQAYASFLLGWPSHVGRIQPLEAPGCTSCSEAHMAQDLRHFYVQDDIKLTRNLTINLGLRYEYSSWYRSLNDPPNASWFSTLDDCGAFEIALGCAGGKGKFVWAGQNPITGEPANTTSTLIKPDKNNWAPRIGIAYMLGSKTTVRSGYSVFFGSNIAWEGNHMRGNYPYALGQDLPLNRTLPEHPTQNPFPPIDFNTVAPSAQHTARKDNVMPYVQQWNFGVQHQLVQDLLVEVNYIGNKGTHLSSFISGNDALPGPGDIQPRRPYPQHLGGFSENRSWATSSYNGLTAKLEKRFSKDLQFDANFAWSKSIDLNSQWGGTSPQDAYNAKDSIGVSDYHRKYIFSGDLVYLLPKVGDFKGAADKIINGWQINAIVQLRSGNYLTPLLTFDNANVGSRGNFQRPDVAGDISGPKTRQAWFNTAAFAAPAPYTFGGAGRNIIEGPGYATVDFAVYKNIPITERMGTQWRFEFFNILNRTNLFGPDTNFGTSSFGVIGGSFPARQIQLAFKFLF